MTDVKKWLKDIESELTQRHSTLTKQLADCTAELEAVRVLRNSNMVRLVTDTNHVPSKYVETVKHNQHEIKEAVLLVLQQSTNPISFNDLRASVMSLKPNAMADTPGRASYQINGVLSGLARSGIITRLPDSMVHYER